MEKQGIRVDVGLSASLQLEKVWCPVAFQKAPMPTPDPWPSSSGSLLR